MRDCGDITFITALGAYAVRSKMILLPLIVCARYIKEFMRVSDRTTLKRGTKDTLKMCYLLTVIYQSLRRQNMVLCRRFQLFLEPTEMLASQSLVHQQSVIGEDVEVIHLTPDWCGVWDIVEHWALRLSMAFTSLDVALINSRAAIMAAAKNKSAQETLKALYEKLSAGESLLVYDKAMKSESLEESEPIWTQAIDVKNNYIVTDLLADIQTIVNDFDREIGIAAIGQKKERMITDEVAQLTADSAARSDCWFECLSRSYDKVNELFPELDLSFEMNYGGELHSYVKGEFTNG